VRKKPPKKPLPEQTARIAGHKGGPRRAKGGLAEVDGAQEGLVGGPTTSPMGGGACIFFF
jgi:hypothetical protein